MGSYKLKHAEQQGGRGRRYHSGRMPKAIKVIIQVAVLAMAVYLFITALFTFRRYEPYDEAASTGSSDGFIAISYFGVERYDSGSTTLISQERLREQIEALKDNGYVTVTQQDILDYYNGEKELPEKALFLMFEDGRRDTALFAQNILEDNNYIATVLTHASRFENSDNKFLTARDTASLLRSSFWELGSNGYRLFYINVFDRYGNYFGNLNSNEFVSINQYLGREYNHYLMDFLRDEDGLSIESLTQMQERIGADYDSMEYIYTKYFGEVPSLYVLMHSNTGQFATDNQVSEVNKEYIYSLFDMNFNREGSCYNTDASSIYDLTRLQPQSGWYSNHLLMRIADDTGAAVSFVTGDKVEAANWDLLSGAVEYRGNTIVLTSASDSYGQMILNSITADDVELSVALNGNVAGNQGIFLRADRTLTNGIYVGIENNVLFVREITNGTVKELYSLDLFSFDGGTGVSVEENEREGLIALQNAVLTYGDDAQALQDAREALDDLESTGVAGLSEGGEEYVPSIDLTDRGSRQLTISLVGDSLTVAVDGKTAIKNLAVSIGNSGCIALQSSALIQDTYSQRNLADDVYDAVYTDLTINRPNGDAVYAYVYGGWDLFREDLTAVWEKVASFFVDTF